MQLVLPSVKYKESFLSALKKYQEEKTAYHEDLNTLDAFTLQSHFQTYIIQLIDESKGKNLPVGYVPHTDYWLVEGDVFIGRVDIRHVLAEQLFTIGGHIGYDIRPSKETKDMEKRYWN